MDVTRRERISEGTSKILFATEDPDVVIQHFKDDIPAARAAAGVAAGEGRGVVKNHVSSLVFTELERAGVRTHFVRRLSEREMLVRRTEILPVVAVIRNIAAGSLTARFGRPEGERLRRPIFELYFRGASGPAVMANDGHCMVFGWVERDELDEMRRIAFRVNEVLVGFFRARSVLLVDFRMEFGRADGKLWVADELTPDSCRLWHAATGRPLDDDIYELTPGAAAGSELYWIVEDRPTPVGVRGLPDGVSDDAGGGPPGDPR